MKTMIIFIVALSFLVLPALSKADTKSLVSISADGKILTFLDGTQYRIDSVIVPSTSAWRGGNQVEVFGKGHNWINVPIRNPVTGGTVYATRIR